MNTRPVIVMGFVFSLCCNAAAMAQSYPSKPIRIIVPTSAGGLNDLTTRAITPKLSEALGQPVVVENRAGADTMIGTEIAAKAAPDGYTLINVFDNFPLSQFLVKSVPYDAAKDFTPISLLVRGPQLIVVPAQLGVKTLGEFIQLAKSKPSALNYATAGAGSSSHLVAELLKSTAGIEVQPVHYKGGAPEVFAKWLAEQTELWGKVIRDRKITLE